MRSRNDFRLVKMAMSGNNLVILHIKSPWLPMWWSAALPGLGHLCMGFYIKGLILMSWEILVNVKAHLNLGILYTFTFQFDKAREVVNPGWALFYGVIFFFAIFDSYRTTTEMNMIARLERKQHNRYFRFMQMSASGFNYLDRANPWVAAAWSALLTGFGHIYNGKSLKAFILLVWAVAIIYLAHINDAIILTFTGKFHRVPEIVHYQWLMFFPSIYIFAIWDSYNDTIEMNKLFSDAQKAYLKKRYGTE